MFSKNIKFTNKKNEENTWMKDRQDRGMCHGQQQKKQKTKK